MTEWVYMDKDGALNAQAGDVLDASGSLAKVHQVLPNYGLIMDTMGAGMKLRITWSIKELSMMGAKIVDKTGREN